MADNDTKYKIDFDTKEALGQLQGLKDAVLKIGESKNLDGLIAGFTKVSGVVAVLGAAFFTLKIAYEAALETEHIKQINNQFETLAKNVGISADALKSGLERSAGGLVDTNDLIGAANKSLVELGDNANKLPKVMELARKYSVAFGKDTLQTFEDLNHAIATGQTKQLKNLGIVIDSEKAYEKYAKSLGVAKSALNESGKQAAILNEVLRIGQDKLKGVSEDTAKMAIESQKLSVAWKNFKETISSFFSVFEPLFVKGLQTLRAFTEALKEKLTGAVDVSGKSTEDLRSKLRDLYGDLRKLEYNLKLSPEGSDTWKSFSAKIEETNKKITQTADKLKYLHKAEDIGGGGAPKFDAEEAKRAELKQEEALIKLRESKIQNELKTAESLAEVARLSDEERWALEDEFENRIEQIKLDRTITNEDIRSQMILEAQSNLQAKLMDLDNQRTEHEQQALDRLSKHSVGTTKEISSGWQAASHRIIEDTKNASNIGSVAFSSMNKNAKTAFMAIGDGSKNAGDAMKGFLFSSIADIAEAKGEFLMAAGIATMNPIEIAGGAALFSLAGLLRSQAGALGSSGGGVGGGGGGGAGAVSAGATSTTPELPQMPHKKEVTIQVSGHYFETEQTKTKLVDLIRESTDATDFKYVQIGQT